MRVPRLRILLLVVPMLVAACGDIAGPSEQSQLEANRQKWQAAGYANYSFTVSILCFCAVTGPVRITVVGDSVILASKTSTGEAIDPRWVPTIEKLFTFIADGIRNDADVLDVTYDPSLGFPSRINYDGFLGAADDEVIYTVSDVVRTSPTAH